MNVITIELCAEDRARIDRLTKALENANPHCDKCVQTLADVMEDEPPIEAPEMPQEATEAPAPETAPPWEENATDAKTEAAAPTVTLEQIQQKVVQLAAAGSKAQVRAIITAYGANVTALKDQPDKWDEVWQKLTALEG